MKKILIAFLLVMCMTVLLMSLFIFFSTIPTITKLGRCFDEREARGIYQDFKIAKNQEERCKISFYDYPLFVTCENKVENNQNFPNEVMLTKKIMSIVRPEYRNKNIKDSHNKICNNYPQYIIQ